MTSSTTAADSSSGGSDSGGSEPPVRGCAADPDAPTVAIGPQASGAADGSDCDNAHPLGWLDDAEHWDGAEGHVGPGVVVQLCGTIAGDIRVAGDGAPGQPIVIDGTAAVLSGGFDVTNRSHWSIRNCTWSDGHADSLITIAGGQDGEFACNHADDVLATAVFLAQGDDLPHDIVIRSNFIRTASDDLGDTQVDIIITEGSYDVVVEGNHLEMRIAGAGAQAHDDIIQTWEKGGSSHGNPHDWTIRYNRLVMNADAEHDRSWLMLENLSGQVSIYGNLFLGIHGAEQANGIAGSGADGLDIAQNTFVVRDGASNNVFNLSGAVTLRNNLVVADSQTLLTGTATLTRENNLWFGANVPGCGGEPGCVAGEDPQFVDEDAGDFSLADGSPALGTGADLGAPYDRRVVAGASWPDPELVPTVGAWNIGAYE